MSVVCCLLSVVCCLLSVVVVGGGPAIDFAPSVVPGSLVHPTTTEVAPLSRLVYLCRFTLLSADQVDDVFIDQTHLGFFLNPRKNPNIADTRWY